MKEIGDIGEGDIGGGEINVIMILNMQNTEAI